MPFTAELGGKGPLIVFADADIEAAAAKAAGQYDDAGQVCLAGTRLLVEESIKDDFLERFHRHTDAHVLGDPRDDRTTVSPLIHRDHLARVEGFVERARANGDRIVRGGAQPEIGGLFYEPTLIEPKANDSEIVQREVFGPVLTFQTFASEDEAVALANSTRYGLSAIVYTGARERAERVGRAVRAGTVWVNTFLVRDLTAPVRRHGHLGRRPRGRRLRARLHERPEDAPDPRRLDGMTTAAPAIDFENDAFARSVPYEMFDWLRRNDPVRWYDWPARQGLLGGHPPRRPGRDPQGHRDLLVRDRRDRPRGPRARRRSRPASR